MYIGFPWRVDCVRSDNERREAVPCVRGRSRPDRRVGVDSGSEVEFKDVLLVRSDDNTYVGKPMVAGAVVKGIVEKVGQGDKVLVFKYKKKKQYRRTRGHRQHFSEVRIEKISVA